jgi:hypothetical protein
MSFPHLSSTASGGHSLEIMEYISSRISESSARTSSGASAWRAAKRPGVAPSLVRPARTASRVTWSGGAVMGNSGMASDGRAKKLVSTEWSSASLLLT